NDRWGGSFVPDAPGRYVYAIEAWTDEFATWRHGFELKQQAGTDLPVDAIEGAGMLTKAVAGGPAASAVILRQCEAYLQTGDASPLLADELKDAMAESQLRPDLTRSQLFPFVADPPRASCSIWRSRLISRCNARRTIPGSNNIRNGSNAGRTDRCAMRKIRPKSTRTSSIQIFPRRTPAHCGTPCAMWCCSGSNRAST